MGMIHIDLFTTLDGVAQAPGGPDEDTAGGFAFGGWQAPLSDDDVGEQVVAGMEGLDALLLGRKTYYPVVLGPGKKVFQGGTVPSNLTLVEPARTSAKGVVQLRYELAEGTPSTGDMSIRDE